MLRHANQSIFRHSGTQRVKYLDRQLGRDSAPSQPKMDTQVVRVGAAGGAAGLVRQPVNCRDNRLYGVRMREIYIAGVCIPIDMVVRFRERDGKVAVTDLMVAVRYNNKVGGAQYRITRLIDIDDDKVGGLDSLELDDESLILVYLPVRCMLSINTLHKQSMS